MLVFALGYLGGLLTLTPVTRGRAARSSCDVLA